MENILIPCPKCGKELRLRDRSLLGRRGKCPKCQHRFLLEEPDEVELQLADSEMAPQMGTSAIWVPDAVPPTATAAAQMTATPAKMAAGFPVGEPVSPALQRLRGDKRPWSKSTKIGVVTGGAVGLIVTGIVIWVVASHQSANSAKSPSGTVGRSDAAHSENRADGGNLPDLQKAAALPLPVERKPVSLKFIPTGARMIIHIRPSALWTKGSSAETVRLCLGPLGVWTGEKLRKLLLFEPKLIEEAVICLYLDNRNEPPEIAYTVRLHERQKRGDLVDKFGGAPTTQYGGQKMYLTEETDSMPARAYMITDGIGKEFASAPRDRAQDMVNAMRTTNGAGGSLDQLLKRTDHRKHLTLIFDPQDLRLFKKYLLPESAYRLLDHFLNRFEDTKIESVAWSFFFGDSQNKRFRSEILLRHKTGLSARELQNDMQLKFRDFPKQLSQAVVKMHPQHLGEKKLIDRLPSMFREFDSRTKTTWGSDDRILQMTTILPEIAGPNLAAGSLFAWQRARTTDFSAAGPTVVVKKKVKTIAERLLTKVEIDFRRVPLQKAFEEIAEGTEIKIEIDGDALKDSGYTKNMPQTFKLGVVPAQRAVYEIVKKYKDLVVIVDEKSKVLTVMTKKFAAAKGLKPFPLKP